MIHTYDTQCGKLEFEMSRSLLNLSFFIRVNGHALEVHPSLPFDEQNKAIRLKKAYTFMLNDEEYKQDFVNLPDFDKHIIEYNEMLKIIESLKAIKRGEVIIKIRYNIFSDTDEVTPYIAWELLEDIGLARFPNGYGPNMLLSNPYVLGDEFTYEQAVEFAMPILKERQKRDEEIAAKEAAGRKFYIDCLNKAKETGEKQLLNSWKGKCDGSVEDCSYDWIYKYITPDGKYEHEREHHA